MKNSTDISLTDLEKKVLDTFIDLLYAEKGFSDVDVKDLAAETTLKINVVKGVVGSLCKKGSF